MSRAEGSRERPSRGPQYPTPGELREAHKIYAFNQRDPNFKTRRGTLIGPEDAKDLQDLAFYDFDSEESIARKERPVRARHPAYWNVNGRTAVSAAWRTAERATNKAKRVLLCQFLEEHTNSLRLTFFERLFSRLPEIRKPSYEVYKRIVKTTSRGDNPEVASPMDSLILTVEQMLLEVSRNRALLQVSKSYIQDNARHRLDDRYATAIFTGITEIHSRAVFPESSSMRRIFR
ncbi:hypothetical protein AAL_07031 [Moelleriella libera RCEF 2490]|uniref:Uncharacterized protein n=1 Tax=Moelleriella libera RCEF 2490 TaxID=1081109 RepID=A0A167Y348_9HYPO|nr:hypothetical protein AAL_07031 [Moelleriella libera RCEF 2490]